MTLAWFVLTVGTFLVFIVHYRFWSFYYTLTTLHALHVLVGVVANAPVNQPAAAGLRLIQDKASEFGSGTERSLGPLSRGQPEGGDPAWPAVCIPASELTGSLFERGFRNQAAVASHCHTPAILSWGEALEGAVEAPSDAVRWWAPPPYGPVQYS